MYSKFNSTDFATFRCERAREERQKLLSEGAVGRGASLVTTISMLK